MNELTSTQAYWLGHLFHASSWQLALSEYAEEQGLELTALRALTREGHSHDEGHPHTGRSPYTTRWGVRQASNVAERAPRRESGREPNTETCALLHQERRLAMGASRHTIRVYQR